jgi:hypothetical protein
VGGEPGISGGRLGIKGLRGGGSSGGKGKGSDFGGGTCGGDGISGGRLGIKGDGLGGG